MEMESIWQTTTELASTPDLDQTSHVEEAEPDGNTNRNDYYSSDVNENNNDLHITPAVAVSLGEEVEESISVSATTVEKRIYYRHKTEPSSESKTEDHLNSFSVQHDDDEGQLEEGEIDASFLTERNISKKVKFKLRWRFQGRFIYFLLALGFLFLLLIILIPIFMRSYLDTQLSNSKVECDKALQNFTNFNSTLGHFKNKDWNLVLHSAIDKSDEQAVKILIDLGADVNRKNNKSERPLHRAAMCSDKSVGLKIIKYLIESWADIFASDRKGYTFLHRLVDDGTTLTPSQFNDIATYLISKNFSRLFNAPGGFTKGIRNPPRAPVSLQYTFTTPFQLAAQNLDIELGTLSLLQENGVDFTVVDSLGRSILNYAIAGKRNLTVVSELIRFGADWRHLDDNNSTLLHEAALYGNVEGIEFMLSWGIPIDIPLAGASGDSPLQWVAKYGRDNALNSVKCLLANRANAELKNRNGETALDRALKRYDKVDKDKIVQLLRNNQ